MMPIQSPVRTVEAFGDEFDAVWQYGGLWIAVWHPYDGKVNGIS
jgi:hypothetical protein